MSDKPLMGVGSSLDSLRAFPADARRAVGYELRRVQMGMMPSDGKPFKCRLFGKKAGGDNKWEFEFEKPPLMSSEILDSTPKKRKTSAFGRT